MGDEHEKLMSLFNEARARRSPEEREAYLAAACGGDAALRRRVEALLEADIEAGNFLKPPSDDPPASEGPGTVIGHYKLLQLLGEGGFGRVYMAEQLEPVRRKVALKIIKLGMDTREVIARFEAERQALAMMDHPNIAKVFDAGATETGQPYFVMELVRGVPITQYCDQNNLPPLERLSLFVQVCHAIQHAPQNGIIHRDVRPSNILVTLHDGVPVPKVIDFGIAKATQQELTEKTVFTRFHQFLGTPAYMSPEQAEMSGLNIDTRTDIYALGVLLYELLTGHTPFDAKELFQAGLVEMRRRIREQEPLRPSTRVSTLADAERTTVARHRQSDAPRLIHLLRGDLDWIVMKALEKDRRRRYDTTNALAQDLERHLKHEPVSASPPSTLYRARKFVRRHRVGVVTAAAVSATLIFGLIGSLLGFTRASRERDRALAAEHQAATNEQKARIEAALSAQVAQFLKEMLKNVPPEVALGRDTALLRAVLDTTAERVGKDLKDQAEVEAELRETIGRVYRGLSQWAKAEAMHRRALSLRKKLFGSEHPAVAESLVSVAYSLFRQGNYTEAEALHREALAMNRKLLGEENLAVAGSLAGLGRALGAQGKVAEAETLIHEALAIYKKLLGDEHPEVASLLDDLVRWLHQQGKLVEAESLERETLAMQRRLFGQEHPDIAVSRILLSGILGDQGRLADAETLYREALAMQRKLLASDNPRLVGSTFGLAALLRRQGKQTEAELL
ncbi:MAG: serine/threonine protein kinase [Verrucomicrobia bacterium]|nr:serine/threonine protein kinase [Verrucomicrobiota bacterium]